MQTDLLSVKRSDFGLARSRAAVLRAAADAGDMAELVDASDLKSLGVIRPGSTPGVPTSALDYGVTP